MNELNFVKVFNKLKKEYKNNGNILCEVKFASEYERSKKNPTYRWPGDIKITSIIDLLEIIKAQKRPIIVSFKDNGILVYPFDKEWDEIIEDYYENSW